MIQTLIDSLETVSGGLRFGDFCLQDGVRKLFSIGPDGSLHQITAEQFDTLTGLYKEVSHLKGMDLFAVLNHHLYYYAQHYHGLNYVKSRLELPLEEWEKKEYLLLKERNEFEMANILGHLHLVWGLSLSNLL